MISLHLGCGKRYFPDFTYHVDLADYPHITHRRNISDLSCFEDNSADLVYSCHCLPYFDRFEVVKVLKEWNRVLKVGGTLRIAVSDFEAWTKVYEKEKDISVLLGPIFGRWEIGNTGNVIYQKTAYDFKSLEQVLGDNGFVNVRRYDYKKYLKGSEDDYSRCFWPHLKVCKSMEEYEKGFQTTLNVECSKK